MHPKAVGLASSRLEQTVAQSVRPGNLGDDPMRKAQTTAQACGMFAALIVLVFAAAALAQSPGSAAKPNSTIRAV
jgi:hypothetical protein